MSPCEASYTTIDSQGQAVGGPSAVEDPLSVFCPETSGREGGPLRWEGVGDIQAYGQGGQLCLGQSTPQWGQLVSTTDPPACGKGTWTNKTGLPSATERHG